MQNISLFKDVNIRKIAISFVERTSDLSNYYSIDTGAFLQLRDVTDFQRHIILTFDLEGRLVNIDLGEQRRSQIIKILQRNFNGDFYVFIDNCNNLCPGHDGLNYYYDYYHKKICSDLEVAEQLVRSVTSLLEKISNSGYQTSSFIMFEEMQITESGINFTNIDRIPTIMSKILANAEKIYNWEGLRKNELFYKAYPTPITVLPPEARPDQNPVFSVFQITQGCYIKTHRGPCNFCSSYLDIGYREKSIDELAEHINNVKEFTGKGWEHVEKIFLADADPFYTKTDSATYLEALASLKPEAVWYESFVSTPAILSKSVNEWEILRKLGLKKLFWGVESADDETLKILGKPHNKKTLYEAAGRLNSAGISYVVIIMSGIGTIHSGHTDRDVFDNSHIKETVDFINHTICQYIYISKFMPQKGTKILTLAQSGQLEFLSEDDSERQYRKFIESIDREVKGAYGGQFVPTGFLG